MKRLVAATVAAVICLGVIGCSNNKPNAINAGGICDRVLERSKWGSTVKSQGNLREQYDIPQRYKYEAKGVSHFMLIVDADVIVPDVSSIPIYEVCAGNIDQHTASTLFGYFCGDTEMWNRPYTKSKAEVQGYIDSLEHQLQTNPHDDTDYYEAKLNEAKQALELAPEAVDYTLADGTMQTIPIYANDMAQVDIIGEQSVIRAEESPGDYNSRSFFLNNIPDYHENAPENSKPGTIDYSGYKSKEAQFSFSDRRNEARQRDFIYIDTDVKPGDDLEPEIQQAVVLTPQEAADKIRNMLSELNLPFEIYEMRIMNDGEYDDYGGMDLGNNYAYEFRCVHVEGGIQTAWQMGGTEHKNVNLEGGWLWGYEYMTIQLDKDGVFSMLWISPHEVGGVLNPDAKLLPFLEILAVFEKGMMLKYEEQPPNVQYDYKYYVEKVTLALQRISEPGEDEAGLLIPVWNFYGYTTGANDAKNYPWNSFLSINAIDGSIIDTDEGM